MAPDEPHPPETVADEDEGYRPPTRCPICRASIKKAFDCTVCSRAIGPKGIVAPVGPGSACTEAPTSAKGEQP